MVNTAVRLWTSQPTKRSIALSLLVPTEIGMRCECGAGLQKRIVRTRSVVRGESTTIYASSKLNRAGRRAARYDSGLKAHRYNQPARKRPAPHRSRASRLLPFPMRKPYHSPPPPRESTFPIPRRATTAPAQSCPVRRCREPPERRRPFLRLQRRKPHHLC